MAHGIVSGPDFVPVLSRGKHRNPRRGACFMEFASYLAGERWSDHPACTHPLLAEVARLVNDHISDRGRTALVPLVPSVIGLTSTDPDVDLRIALACASVALPVASAERQRLLALGVLTCERALAELEGRPHSGLSERSRQVLDEAPDAEQWARRFMRTAGVRATTLRPRAARRVARCAVEGVALACIPDPDTVLHELLSTAIDAFGPVPATPANAGPPAQVRPATPGDQDTDAVPRHTSEGAFDGRPITF